MRNVVELTFFSHAGFKTFSQTTISTLIAFILVHYTVPGKPVQTNKLFINIKKNVSMSQRSVFDAPMLHVWKSFSDDQ
jgi:hypothetical protein